MRAVNAVLTGAIALAMMTGLSTGAGAQTLRASSGPAETPPSSFTGQSYVDSRGCMYIRAGYDGNVSWIPRVTRGRIQVCGQKPSLGGRAAKTAKTTIKTPRIATVTTALGTPPARTKRKKINWNWFGAPRKTKVKIATVRAPVLASKLKPKTRIVTIAPSSPRNTRNVRIRTTPQAVHPADYYNGRLGRNGVAGQTVQVTRAQPYVLPAGYKSLLAPDIANARRGIGTAQGQAQMDLLWTQTTPRRLIDVTTGRDMTVQLAQIKYPYTSVTASTRSFVVAGTTSVHRKHKKKRPLDAASPLNMIEVDDVSAFDPTVKSRIPKIELKAAAMAEAAAFRFVQVATFGVSANASRTIARFNTDGISAVSRPYTRKGKVYAIVMLGPFKDGGALKSALASARGAGFSDAFYVK